MAATSKKKAAETESKWAQAGNQKSGQSSPYGTNLIARITESVGDNPRRGLSALNDVPIIFDGKLEDQFGNPVPGATIDASVRIYNGMKSTVERFAVMSDEDGYFHIDHGNGEALGIKPNKEGYVLATSNIFFKYSHMFPDRFSPDPKNPTVLKMWRLQGAEPLASIDQRYRFPYTAEAVSFDLVAGKIVPSGGDLKIVVARPPGIISQQHPQDWGIRIDVVQGGLITTSAEQLKLAFSAPEDGYIGGADFRNNNGPDLLDLMVFLKSRGGQVYAKVHFLLRINKTPDQLVSLTIRGAANTNASRNWEATAGSP